MVDTKKHKVLITGGNGYIGARLSLHLAQEGYVVIPLCYPDIPHDKPWIEQMDRVVVGDVRDEVFLKELATEGFDTVVHLVSLDHHQSAGNPSVVASVNITPTWSLLDIFSKAGTKKFVYFSTMQVYGVLEGGVIDEMHKTQCVNAYALTHWVGEELCRYYNQNSAMACRVVRLSNSYGAPVFDENNCWWLVVNDLCRTAHGKKEIVLLSDGSPIRDFIHGNDVVRAVEAIVNTDALHTTYNVSSGFTFSILELAQAVQQVYEQRYGHPIELRKAASTSNTVAARYTIDNSRLLSIGYQAQWDLERGIADLFDYLDYLDRK